MRYQVKLLRCKSDEFEGFGNQLGDFGWELINAERYVKVGRLDPTTGEDQEMILAYFRRNN